MPFTVEEFRDLRQNPGGKAGVASGAAPSRSDGGTAVLARASRGPSRRDRAPIPGNGRHGRQARWRGRQTGDRDDLVKTQKRLVIDVADINGERLERRYRERAPAYFGGLIRRARALTT